MRGLGVKGLRVKGYGVLEYSVQGLGSRVSGFRV